MSDGVLRDLGQAKSMMFMHISPEDSSRGETLSTLNFGSRVSQITLGQVGLLFCVTGLDALAFRRAKTWRKAQRWML